MNTAMRNVQMPNAFLAAAAEELRQGHSVKLCIGGDSMQPFIHGTADTVVVTPLDTPDSLRRYRAYFYRWQGHYIIHRYLHRDASGRFVMMGDGNLCQREVVSAKDVLGELQTLIRPNGHTVSCTGWRWRVLGWLWHRVIFLKKMKVQLANLYKKL